MKIKISVLLLMVALVFTACAVSGPEANAKKFIIAINAMNWDDAMKLSTTEGAQVLQTLKGLMGMMSQEQINQSKKNLKSSDITIVSSKVDGDTATIVYKLKGEDNENTLNMKKVDGQWKANYSKNF
ncbi:MAG TPA: DUF4878 domain-containing protein [Spirochaetia bacterium]|nr:DUF4878 domain-containing protein [Spirochaetales bacterium]HRS66471.1 DUF4878 domain-containing protein [Spirochaetia bacterium]HOT59013.1 DUF4878 domain-containing protein [Spirochaetales bacterium]HPD80104.1 DUF4878 domain-containing protein [Spirochaetales bacterium]HQG40381.1 DUF4878 domain-containing protein [Spirochaetales bacterium]